MKRRLPLRLLRLSPALVLALILGIWFFVPLELRSISLRSPLYEAAIGAGQMERPDGTVEALRILDLRDGGNGRPERDSSIVKTAQGLARAMRDEYPAVVDAEGTALTRGLPPDHQAFDSVVEHERRTGGETLALAYTANPHPPVYFSYVADAAVLTPEERESLDDDAAIDRIRRVGRQATKDAVLGVDVGNAGTVIGFSDQVRGITYSSQFLDSHFYEVYLLAPNYGDGVVEMPPMHTWETLEDPSIVEDLKRAARRANGAVIIVGPVDAEAIVLRATEPLERHAQELAGLYASGPLTTMDPMDPRRLPSELSQELGGAVWHSSALIPVYHAPGDANPLSAVRVVGVYERNPQIPELWDSVGKAPVRVAQVWLALNFVFVLGALGVLLLASLIASPVSFLYERRRAEEIELERERARVQQQARRRVLDRLTRLSAEVDEVAQRTAGKSSREVADVAADIEATVTALRDILGDANGRKEKADA